MGVLVADCGDSEVPRFCVDRNDPLSLFVEFIELLGVGEGEVLETPLARPFPVWGSGCE